MGEKIETSTGKIINWTVDNWLSPIPLIATITGTFYMMGYTRAVRIANTFGLANFPSELSLQQLTVSGFAVFLDNLGFYLFCFIAAFLTIGLLAIFAQFTKFDHRPFFKMGFKMGVVGGILTSYVILLALSGHLSGKEYADGVITNVLKGCKTECREYELSDSQIFVGQSIFVDEHRLILYTQSGVKIISLSDLETIRTPGGRPKLQTNHANRWFLFMAPES